MKRNLFILVLILGAKSVYATGEPSTYFQIYVSPNNDAVKRDVYMASEKSKFTYMKKSSFIEKGNKAPTDYFVGEVNVNLLLEKEDYNTIMGIVSFDAGARTNWHTHTNGQILIVVEGVGYYQEKGKPIEVIQSGDVIQIPVNVEHWHGASHKKAMRHFAIIPDSATDKTEWLIPVTEDEYNNANTTE